MVSTNTFGGYSPGSGIGFSQSGVINQFLVANSASFVEMVASYSVLLSSIQNKQEEVKKVAQRQVYPRIGLILAAAKDLDNNLLFEGRDQNTRRMGSDQANTVGSFEMGTNINTTTAALESVYENVIELMTSQSSPFAEGITAVAAALTAAVFIKQLPLNGDIRNIDLGNEIEKRGIEDLERIIQLYESGRSGGINSSLTNLPALNSSATTFYIALDIDPNALPRTVFDSDSIDLLDQAIIIDRPTPERPQPLVNQVRAIPHLTIPEDKIAFGWFYISSMEGESYEELPNANGTASVWRPVLSSSPGVERTFVIQDGWTADDIIEALADEINNYTLVDNATANIIASPNRGELLLQNAIVPRKKIYDEPSPYERKLATFRLMQQINYLSFNARRYSNAVNREMVILRFFTVDKAALAQRVVQQNPALDQVNLFHRGQWTAPSLDTNQINTPDYISINDRDYELGELVDVGNGGLYVCIQPHASYRVTGSSAVDNRITAKQPGTIEGVGYWSEVLTEVSRLRDFKDLAVPYVEGLLYGLSPSYTYLDKRGPKSLTLVVNEGGIKTLSTRDPNQGGASSPRSLSDKTKLLAPDTFFFRRAANAIAINGNLKIRISSLDFSKIPEDMSSEFDPVTKALSIPLTVETAEEVALSVLERLFKISQITDVLSALVLPNALQLTAFKKVAEDVFTGRKAIETREVIDILEVPSGLEIATGTVTMVTGNTRELGSEAALYQSFIEPKTSYSARPRSLVIDAEEEFYFRRTSSSTVENQLPDNKDYGVVGVSKGQRSQRIQHVYDRLDAIHNMIESKKGGASGLS